MDQNKAVFVEGYTGIQHQFYQLELQVDSQKHLSRYQSKINEADFEIVLQAKPCQDIMSGEMFSTIVTISYNNKVYRGCGKALH